MGSGERAYRTALGQLQAQDVNYLAELTAGDEDFTDIFEKQNTQIKDLSEQLTASASAGPRYVSPPAAVRVIPQRNFKPIILSLALLAGIFLFRSKK